MRGSLLGKMEERLKENERYALAFFEVYRKTFIAPAWELASVDFRAAVTDGVMAAIAEYERARDGEVRTGRSLPAESHQDGDAGE